MCITKINVFGKNKPNYDCINRDWKTSDFYESFFKYIELKLIIG